MNGRLDLGVADLLAVEVAGHQLVAGLGRGLDERLAARLLARAHLVGDRHLLWLAGLVDVGVLLDHVDVATERLGGADRQVDRGDLWPELGLQPVQHRVVVRVLAVHLVDEDEAGELPLLGEAPDLLRPDLDSRRRVDHHDRGVDRCQRLDHIGLEVGVAGGVDEGDPGAIGLECPDREVDALAPLLLIWIVVERGGARVHAAQSRDRAGVEEHRLGEARLAGATVRDERHVSNPVGAGRLHRSSLCVGRRSRGRVRLGRIVERGMGPNYRERPMAADAARPVSGGAAPSRARCRRSGSARGRWPPRGWRRAGSWE